MLKKNCRILPSKILFSIFFTMYRIGLDIGSTTEKIVVASSTGEIVYKKYERHYSEIVKKSIEMLLEVSEIVGDDPIEIAISGSAGMGLAEKCEIPFIQEVYATRLSAKEYLPQADVIIELGGEDAKILFLSNGLEVRMNGTCAGGTGAFIDQMATLLGVEKEEIGRLAESYTELYTIASRCGVFAKSDIQPLINQGAKKENIAASILLAVVNQTIAGLAQGRKIEGNVVYLGGPLSFNAQLRKFFDKELKTEGVCPENSLYYVAMGAALSLDKKTSTISEVIKRISSYKSLVSFNSLSPLFETEEEYSSFCSRHEKARVKEGNLEGYSGGVYLGLDAGSTTIKATVISKEGELLDTFYSPNNGNPVKIFSSYLLSLYEKHPSLRIISSSVTGYGEDLLREAFLLDYSLVETQAHFIGARFFMPSVDFIIDIGGQDIKCFKIVDGAIDDIFLNEACSSGCGSFLQTFANALGLSSEEFAQKAIYSKKPVDLGSRCTVFMNSSVKQAQKDGASTEDISAGLAISVVKNALYKVIRTSNSEDIGNNIVVQGGTFLNDAVLRAFELELGKNVIRPSISGLMGAYGAALYAKKQSDRDHKRESSIIKLEELKNLKHEVKSLRCNGCTNHCLLTINIFQNDRKLISGNKCDRPISGKIGGEKYDIYSYKEKLLEEFINDREGGERGTIGLPLALSMYELLPFYHTLFKALGYKVITSPFSNRELYISGQGSIASDTICFPAKLMHGHVEYLKRMKVDKIFIPCSSYNIDEKKGTNHFNCPVVAYYGEVVKANMDLGDVLLYTPYLSLDNPKHFALRIASTFGLEIRDVKKATKLAYQALNRYREKVVEKGKEIIELSRKEKREIIILAGRPYHLDRETNHSIDKLIVSLGCSVISEDSISPLVAKMDINVLNQWTYHNRLYAAAEYSTHNKDINLVQFVSFGCGLDAVTTDEVREILRRKGKIYTELKIDEITNVGAVRIRLRSLLAALKEREDEC